MITSLLFGVHGAVVVVGRVGGVGVEVHGGVADV